MSWSRRTEKVFGWTPPKRVVYPSMTEEQVIAIWNQEAIDQAIRVAKAISRGNWELVRDESMKVD